MVKIINVHIPQFGSLEYILISKSVDRPEKTGNFPFEYYILVLFRKMVNFLVFDVSISKTKHITSLNIRGHLKTIFFDPTSLSLVDTHGGL